MSYELIDHSAHPQHIYPDYLLRGGNAQAASLPIESLTTASAPVTDAVV